MSIKTKHLTILFTCIVMILIAFFSYAQKQNSRTVLSDGEIAKARGDCQNLMSKHNYYHAMEMHAEELLDIWVKEDGAYAETAKFSQPPQVMMGFKVIKRNYGAMENPDQSIQEFLENHVRDPEKNKGMWGMHLNTTPVIEVAGDGKSAKGIWYSPGVQVLARPQEDGTTKISGNWWWEKYGVDFVKEDGEWKIWHMQMYYDHTPQIDPETGAVNWIKPGSIGGGQREPGTVANPDPYKMWSPDTVPVLRPELPEPYYTFSETFSY